MFKIKLFVFAILFFTSFFQENVYTKISHGFLTADAGLILSESADKVLIQIDKKESVYSKAQAEMVLKEFLSKNKVLSFKYIYKGSKNETFCAVGNFQTSQQNFRLVLSLSKKDSRYLLEQMVIETK